MIYLARKPLAERTVAAQVLATGTGALNVDGCRVELVEGSRPVMVRTETEVAARCMAGVSTGATSSGQTTTAGRWPANLAHDGSEEVLEAFARFGESKSRAGWRDNHNQGHAGWSSGTIRSGPLYSGHSDTGTAARFFYCAKASKAERAGSKHPTVKPLALMRWLCRLITPPGGIVLDPFAGSGTTGEAALLEGCRAVLIENEAEYLPDIQARIARAKAERARPQQLSLVG